MYLFILSIKFCCFFYRVRETRGYKKNPHGYGHEIIPATGMGFLTGTILPSRVRVWVSDTRRVSTRCNPYAQGWPTAPFGLAQGWQSKPCAPRAGGRSPPRPSARVGARPSGCGLARGGGRRSAAGGGGRACPVQVAAGGGAARARTCSGWARSGDGRRCHARPP